MKAKTIVIIIDALGHELSAHHHFHPGGLKNRVLLKTVLGFSQAALTTILTGLSPDEHGLWMMYSFSPGRKRFGWLRLIPGSVPSERRWFRSFVRWNLEKIHGVKAYYSLYAIPREILIYLDLPATRNLFAPGGVESVRTIFDELERRGIPWLSWDYRTPEEAAFAEMEEAVKGDRASFYMLYTAGLDADIHRFGWDDGHVASHLSWYAGRIERIVQAAGSGISHETRVIVMGDHGMCNVTEHIDIIPQVDSLGLRIPDDFLPFYDSTMARFKIFSQDAGSVLKNLLEDHHSGRILTPHEMNRLGVHFPDGRFGDLIFLTHPGTIILPSFMDKEPVAAMHGYHPDTPAMYSVMFTNINVPTKEISISDVAGFFLPDFKPTRGGDAA